jgi:Family of unknown function (DUF6493)
VTELAWPALRALIDAGDVGAVVRAVDGLQDRQRRALAGPLRAYPRALWRDPSTPWGFRGRTIAALRVAGAGCLSGADTLARWLSRQDLRTWDRAQTTGELLRVLTARQLPWLGELAHRLAGRLPTDGWQDDLWRLTASLVTSSGIAPPTTDGFVLGWMRTHQRGDPENGRLADALAADPFLAVLAPRLFEVDGVGRQLAWSASRWTPPAANWPLTLTALAASGRLDRAMLLDGCLGRLLGGGQPAELRGFLLLHQALDPDLDEVAGRTRDYARLAADAPSAVAVAAQRALRRLDDAGRLELGLLLEASRAVLYRPEQQLVRAQLSWLDAVARRQPDHTSQILPVVAVAFAQQRAQLQTRALSVTLRHARHADQPARTELLRAAAALPADLRHRAATALDGHITVDQPTPWPALPAPTPRQLPPPIGTPAELAEELAALLEGDPTVDPVALERLLAALVSFAHRDRDALRSALDPVLTRHRIQPPHPAAIRAAAYLNEYQQLTWAILAAVTPPAKGRRLRRTMRAIWRAALPRRHLARLGAPAPRLAMLYRLHEIACGLTGASPPPLLLATPTRATGHLELAELAARLQRAATDGWQPWEYDLQQALLRLPRQPDPAAAARARQLPTPAGRRLAAWLANGGMVDPLVTRVVRTVPKRQPWPSSSSQPMAEELVGVFATVTPPSDHSHPPALPAPLAAAHRLLPQQQPLAALLCELAAPPRWERWPLGEWLHCWPALLPSHRDVIAAHLQARLPNPPFATRGDGPVLPLLAEADGPVGPGLTLALANGLGARDPSDRAAAVDALLILAGRRQLDGPALGGELGALAALNLLQLGRITPALRDLARAGAPAEVLAILAAAIPSMLPPATARPPRGLPDLIALAAEVAGAGGGGRPIPQLAAITARGGSSRLVAESRRLERLLTGTPPGTA